MQDENRPIPPKARDDDICPPVKRSRVAQPTPLDGQEMTSKDVHQPLPTSEKAQDVDGKHIPFKAPHNEKKWIETSDERNHVRDDEGRINHGSIKMYGETIDLGLGAQGLKENRRTRTALKKFRAREYDGFQFVFSDQKRKVTESETKARNEIVSVALKKQSMSQQVPKAAANTSIDTAVVSLPPASQGWGDLFKKEEGTWTCLYCTLSNNPKTASNCLCCDTAKGEEKPSEADAGISKKEDTSEGPTFCFDNKDSGNTSKFSFGAPASDAADSNASGGFTFGAAKPEDSKGDTLKSPTGGFTFEAAKPEDSKGDTLKRATGGFTFIATSTVAVEKKDDTPKSTF